MQDNQDYSKKSTKKYSLSIIITFFVALGVAFLIAYCSGIFDVISKRRIYAILSDACFAPGGLFLGFGILLKIADGGFFDGVSFTLKRAFRSLIPGARIRKEQNYVKYKEEKEKMRKNGSYSALLIVGIVFVVLAILFLVLYQNN